MQYTEKEVYACQLLHYLVTQQQYQLVRVQNQKNDHWLMNASNKEYPVICISCEYFTDISIDEAYIRNVHRAILDVIGREGKLLILNTNESSENLEKEFADQMVVLPQKEMSENIQKSLPGIELVLHGVEDSQTECATLTKEIEEYEIHQRRGKRRKMNIRMPKITAGIIILCFVVFLFSQAMMVYFQDLTTGVIASGAYYKMSVVAMQEYWRILTTGLLHFDVFHLLINAYALFTVGLMCEKLYKPLHYLLIFFVSLCVGSLFAFIADGNIVSVGMSAGILGLTASFVVVLVENHSIRLPVVRNSVMRLIFLNLLLTMMPNVSWIGHIGGFISGGFLGVMLVHSERWKSLRMNTGISFIALLFCLAFFATQVTSVEPMDKETDKILIDGFENAGWSDYAEQMRQSFGIIYEGEKAK